jgi:hypothetical protein
LFSHATRPSSDRRLTALWPPAQYAQSALRATETALGFLGSTNIRVAYTTARLAASG